jgi:hypothetical protein
VEQPEQAHRRLHADEHLTKVDKDRYQCKGVRRQVLKLEAVELQQLEDEGGQWRRKPS